jgi:hypothetical protein
MTAQEAKNQTIYFVNRSYEVKETNLYDFVMESAHETTTPRGVGRKLHIRDKERECACWDGEKDTFDPLCKKCYKGTEFVYQVWTWGPNGNRQRFIIAFDTEEEAEDYIFNYIKDTDFDFDDQRNTMYHHTEQEALHEAISTYAERADISYEVAEHLFRKREIVKTLRHEKEQEAIREHQKFIENQAAIYAKMINPVEGEKYKETANRLSERIGMRISKTIFHTAVKMVRKLNIV